MDEVTKAKHQMYDAREAQQERAAEFWQNTIRQGQTLERTDEQQRAEQKPKQPQA
jgi:hypothetical protein